MPLPLPAFSQIRNEILFGSGTYTLGTVEAGQRRHLLEVELLILEQPDGPGFRAQIKGKAEIEIGLSAFGHDAIAKLGFDPEDVRDLGMREATAEHFLRAFEDKILTMTGAKS